MVRVVRPQIYLASASPRRRVLLDQIGVRHEVVPGAIDESRRAGESIADCVLRLALAKARAGHARLDGRRPLPVLGADTVVAIDDRMFGQPADRADALAMLECLSSRTHEVWSAVAVVGADGVREAQALSRTRVTFRSLSRAEREAYWDSGEPAGKAGAYAIQGLAALFVERIEGSYSGVMGLPLCETAALLRGFDVDPLQFPPS